METLLCIIFIIACVWYVKHPSNKAHNRTCPPGMRADWNQMNMDRINGKSQRDIDIKFNQGGYDVPNDIHTSPKKK